MTDIEVVPEVPSEERRAPDQEGAIEVAFADGTLPPEDRRTPDVTDVPEPVAEPVAEITPAVSDAAPVGVPLFQCSQLERETLDALDKAGLTSTFTKAKHGWDVKFVDGGTILFVQGPSIPHAIGSHGAQREYPYMPPGPIVHPPIQSEEVAG